MARPWTKRATALGPTEWMTLSPRTSSFVALGFVPSSGAVLTATVQHTFDMITPYIEDFSLSRSTTTATMKYANHGLSVGDSIIINNAGAPFDGDHTVASVVDANNVTFTVANSGALAGGAGGRMSYQRVFDHPTMAALSARADGNYAFTPAGTRLLVTAYTSGFADLLAIQENG